MLYRVPRNVSRLYKKIGLFPLLYTVIKWALTPFEKMEEYIPKKGKILDLGCGNGLFSNYLAIKCQDREITGLDYSTKRIKIARKTIQGRKNIAFSLGHIESIKLSPCDCIIFSDFLHHLSYQNQEELIRRSFESLNQDGILIIKEIDKQPKWKFIFSFVVDSLLNLRKKLCHRDSSEFKKLLSDYSFAVETIQTHRSLLFSNIIYIGKKMKTV